MADKKIVDLAPIVTLASTDISEVSDSAGALSSKKETRAQGLAFTAANIAGAPYVLGDLFYAASTTTFGKLTDIATGNVLLSGGIGAAPSYGKVGLTTHVTGILPLANGGSNANLTASLGGIIYSTASAMAILAGTATAGQMLRSGSSAAPTWSTAVWPATTTINQFLYSSSANTVIGLATANSAALLTNSSGVPSMVALSQGEVPLGASTGAIAGFFTSSDGTVNIDTSVDGEIDLTVGSGAEESLQDAYNIGNTIDLADNRPLQINGSTVIGSTTNAITTPSGGTNSTPTLYVVRGWTFVPNVNIQISALQYFDLNFIAFTSATREVGIYEKSSGIEIVSTFVSKSDPLDGALGIYRTHVLPNPVTLAAGAEYVVAAVVSPSDIYNTTATAVSAANISVTQFCSGDSDATVFPLTFPTSFTSTANVTPAAYFEYETATVAMQASWNNTSTDAYAEVTGVLQGTRLEPKMSAAQFSALAGKTEGLRAWDTTNHRPTAYDGTTIQTNAWVSDLSSSIISTVEVTGTTQSMAVSTVYIANNASLITLTLPATAAIGSMIRVLGKGAGGWRIAQNSGQQINLGNTATTAGVSGRLDSTNQYDSITLTCITANTTWTAGPPQGNITVT